MAAPPVTRARSRPRTIARCASSTLNALCSRRGGVGQLRGGRAPRTPPRSAGAPTSAASARRARHGLVPTPPSASRTSATTPSSTSTRGRDRHERELVRLPVAELEVQRACGERRGGNSMPTISSPCSSGCSTLRRVARQQVEVVDRDRARAAGPDRLDDRVERHQRDGDVGGMRGDAVLARAEDRVTAVEPSERRAAASPARACCRARRRRGSTRSGCAGSRLPPIEAMLRSCSDALEQQRLARSPGSAATTLGVPRRRRSSARARRCAGRRRPDPRPRSSGRSLMSTRCVGARDAERGSGRPRSCRRRGTRSPGRRRQRRARRRRRPPRRRSAVSCRHRPLASRTLADRGADVRIGGAAADVAAHELARSPPSVRGVALLDQLDRGHDLPRACSSRTGRRRAR